ncbi:MAG: sensor histidine kinase, partial [Candidatus Angelobacter sp.]
KCDSALRITGFAGELRQIFSNIISNAIDAIGQNGTIFIKASAGVSWNGSGTAGVRVSIADTGSGIGPEHLQKIYEPFYTTKQDVGTGLGLWVSRGIIQKHNGSIRVRSTTRRGRSGTVFSVFLPAEGVALAKQVKTCVDRQPNGSHP